MIKGVPDPQTHLISLLYHSHSEPSKVQYFTNNKVVEHYLEARYSYTGLKAVLQKLKKCFMQNQGTHVLQWTLWVHYDTLDLGAMILHEIESILGPLKYTSFFKVQSLKLMENHGPINEKLLGLKAKKFFFVGP